MAKAPEAEEPEGMIMTPMIDVTFQLLIFFLIINDMSRAQLEDLSLPDASKAVKVKLEDPNTLVLNILPDGTVKIKGLVYFRPKPSNPTAADVEKLAALFDARRNQEMYQLVKGKADLVSYPVLIRADRSTPFQYIQLILMVAADKGGVTNVQLGAMFSKES